jgi:ornithine--oxo-acid transaminase
LVPVSAFVTNRKLMDEVFQPGMEGSTYGGYPLACVAVNAALDVIEQDNLAERSAELGTILKKKILDIASRSSKVKEVRGTGLFIGIEVNDGDAMAYCRKMLDYGILANDSHGHTIRVSPPLIITNAEIDYICERLEKVLIG